MPRDPRSLPRSARRRVKRAAGRLGGVDEVRARLAESRARLAESRAQLAETRAQLARTQRRRDAVTSDLTRVRRERDEGRERISQLKAQLADANDEIRATETRRKAAVDKVTAFGYAYRGARAAALGQKRPSALGTAPGRAPEGDELRRQLDELRVQGTRARFVELLASGRGLDGAVMDLIRASTSSAEMQDDARRIAQVLHDTETTSAIGALATGLIAHQAGLGAFAWERLRNLPDELWLRHVPSEYLLLAGQHDPTEARRAVEMALEHPEELGTQTWLALTRRAMGFGLGDLCTRLADRFDGAAAVELAAGSLSSEQTERLEHDRDWMARWAPRVAAGPAAAAQGAEGAIPFAVMSYDQPDPRYTSSNIGDYVQTIASLAHLVRHTGAVFDAGSLGSFAARLAERVPDRFRVEGPRAPVELYPIDRDAASYSSVPEGTWLLAFGWYAHKIAGVRHDFPFPERLRPIYVSFHVNRRTVLTGETIEHLRAHAPIGCRDHSTVDLLLGLDIPAFFSGCLTSTVRYVRPENTPSRSATAPTAYVDMSAPEGATRIRNERPEVAHAGFEENLSAALASLDEYASSLGKLVTSRLHAYLPARTLGCEVDFVPKNPSDVRFAGLAPLTDEEVFEMGRGLADLLEPVHAAILAGEDEATVRRIWGEVTAERVAAARARHEEAVDLPSVVDINEAVATVQRARIDVPRRVPGPAGEEMELVLALDGNLKEQFLVVVDALVEHASRPLHLNVLVRDHDQADVDRAAALFPAVSFSWLPCDEVDHGNIHGMLAHVTVSTMDRLLLPELLPDVDRVLYHDIDALPVADIAELHDIDLQGHALAARDSEASAWQSGYNNIFQPAAFRGLAPGMGSELIRRETARHAFDFVAFNAGIMVLDLARMRADDFCERFLPYAHHFGMHDQHILNVYAGGDRLRLAPEWNARPSQEEVVDAKIIHWAGGQKPWVDGYVTHKSVWQRHEAALSRRRAALAGNTPGGPVDTSTGTRESL